MNYRHIYHAGNFGDALKHVILTALVKSFLKKDTPFCYLDTHAAVGKYDLQSTQAQINQEFELGVGKILTAANPPALVKDYLDCIQKINHDNQLKYYPGSPGFVKPFLREHDRMVLCELHPEENKKLKQVFGRDKQTAIHQINAYEALKAFLPPKERRGLVLIDPPYEKHDEFTQLAKSLPQAIDHWPTGVFALWYPIKNRAASERFLKQLQQKITQPVLIAELTIYPEITDQQLNGSGMLIVNPPWKLEEELKEVLPWLWHTLKINQQGKYDLRHQ